MGTLKKRSVATEANALPVAAITPQEAGLQRLRAALTAAEGLWKDRRDIPKDGVEYQEQLRTEWP